MATEDTAPIPEGDSQAAAPQEAPARPAVTGSYLDDLPDEYRAQAPPEWEKVEKQFKENFPDLDAEAMRRKYESARKMAVARRGDSYSGEDPVTYTVRRALPFVSSYANWDTTRKYDAAKKRIETGAAEEEDYRTVAGHEKMQEFDANRGLGGKILSGVAHVPAVAGEFAVGGQLMKGAGAAFPRALGWLAPAAGEAAAEAPAFFSWAGARAAAGQAVNPLNIARSSVQTAAAPSMFLDRWAQNNLEVGRDAGDLRGLPAAYALGVAQVQVLGAVGRAGQGIGGSGVGAWGQRVAAGTGAGMAGQTGVDVGASAVSELLPEGYKLEKGYGVLGQALQGKFGDAGERLAVEAATFMAFSAIHAHHDPKAAASQPNPIKEELEAYLQFEQGRGTSRATAINRANEVHDVAAHVLQENPDATRADVKTAFEDAIPRELKKYGNAVANIFPEKPTDPASAPKTLAPPGAPETPPAAPPGPPEGEASPRAAPEPQEAQEGPTPPPGKGMVRFYHGGDLPEDASGKGGRDFTPDPEYARGYAEKHGGKVAYIDLPEDHPLVEKSFDDSGTNVKAPYKAFSAPEDVAKGRKQYIAEPPKPATPQGTAAEVKAAFDGMGQASREAGEARNRELVDKQGYVGFRKPAAVEAFEKDHPGWSKEVVDGETRFKPPTGERRQEGRPSKSTWDNIKAEHPDWTVEQIGRESARRADELSVDPQTGLGSRAQWAKDAQEHGAHATILDVPSMHAVNNTFGDQAGDALLAAHGAAMREAGIERGYRKGGDELGALFDSAEEQQQKSAKYHDILQNTVISWIDANGKKVSVKGFGAAISHGATPSEAQARLPAAKEAARAAGLRGPNSETLPPRLAVQDSAGGEEAGPGAERRGDAGDQAAQRQDLPSPRETSPPAPEEEVAARLTADELHRRLVEGQDIPGLSKTEQSDLYQHIVEQKPLADIGKRRGVNKQKVARSIENALQKLHGNVEEPGQSTGAPGQAARATPPGELPNRWVENPTSENLSDAILDHIQRSHDEGRQLSQKEEGRLYDLAQRVTDVAASRKEQRAAAAEATAFLTSLKRGAEQPASVRRGEPERLPPGNEARGPADAEHLPPGQPAPGDAASAAAPGRSREAPGNELKPDSPYPDEPGRPFAMGAAALGELTPSAPGREGPRRVALANDSIDSERLKDGLSPILGSARSTDAEVWDKAMRRLELDPEAGKKLAEELASKPRSTTDVENALLLRHRVAISNEYRGLEKTYERLADKGGHDADLAVLQDRIGTTMEDLYTADLAAKRSGSEWGKAGRFRQMLMAEDFSVERMIGAKRAAVGRPLTPEEGAKVKEMSDKIADLQAKVDAKAADPKSNVNPETWLKFKLYEARQEYLKSLEADRLKNRTVVQKAFGAIGEGANLVRSVITSLDYSAVLRQGGMTAASHPILALKAMPEMFRAGWSKYQASRAQQALEARPNYENGLYKRSGLYFAEKDAGLSGMEESYMSRLADKIPGVAGSERAYTTYLNRIRADVFDSLVGTLGKKGAVTDAEARVIANYVNASTGRGSLGFAEKAAVPLATVFFSPRFLASRFQLLSGQPMWGGTGRTRGLIAKEYARAALGLAVVYGMSKLVGRDDAEIGTDPGQADFGKIRIGNSRIDPLFSMSQTARFTYKEGAEVANSVKRMAGYNVPKKKFGDPDAADILGRFLRTKLAPVPGAALDVATGKNVVGEPQTLLPYSVDQALTGKSHAGNLTIPLSIRDVYEAMQDQGVPKGAALGILAAFGMGFQAYEDKKKQKIKQ